MRAQGGAPSRSLVRRGHRHNEPGATGDLASQAAQQALGHNLVALVNAALGAEGARYLPPITNEAVLGWSEQMRYHPAGKVDAFKADAYLAGAELAAGAIVQMTLDGVL